MNLEKEISDNLKWTFEMEPLPNSVLAITHSYNAEKKEVIILYYVDNNFSEENYEEVSSLTANFNASLPNLVTNEQYKKVNLLDEVVPIENWSYFRKDLSENTSN